MVPRMPALRRVRPARVRSSSTSSGSGGISPRPPCTWECPGKTRSATLVDEYPGPSGRRAGDLGNARVSSPVQPLPGVVQASPAFSDGSPRVRGALAVVPRQSGSDKGVHEDNASTRSPAGHVEKPAASSASPGQSSLDPVPEPRISSTTSQYPQQGNPRNDVDGLCLR